MDKIESQKMQELINALIKARDIINELSANNSHAGKHALEAVSELESRIDYCSHLSRMLNTLGR